MTVSTGQTPDSAKDFIEKLDHVIEQYSLLKHPYYQAWNRGELSRESLAEYSKQYYGHVQSFPVYLSAVHSRCDDIEVRQLLLEKAEKRDPKGLYKKARAGEIKGFTGIDDPYEAPENAELIIKTDELNLEDSVKAVLMYLDEHGMLSSE